MKDIKKTNWFEERELPNIENDLDLLKAFSIVKNRFNGNPRCYTRNDYILFINTIYAAFRDLYYSTHLQKDITTDIKVGFVDKGTVLEKGTSLQKIMEMIFIGNGEEPEPEPPVVEENVIYTNIINPVGSDYYDGEGYMDNLQEYVSFDYLDFSTEILKDVNNKIDKTSWGVIPDVRTRGDIKMQIISNKPLEDILEKIVKHTTSDWSEDQLFNNPIKLTCLKLIKEDTFKGQHCYFYELDESEFNLALESDVLIKFVFK